MNFYGATFMPQPEREKKRIESGRRRWRGANKAAIGDVDETRQQNKYIHDEIMWQADYGECT